MTPVIEETLYKVAIEIHHEESIRTRAKMRKRYLDLPASDARERVKTVPPSLLGDALAQALADVQGRFGGYRAHVSCTRMFVSVTTPRLGDPGVGE